MDTADQIIKVTDHMSAGVSSALSAALSKIGEKFGVAIDWTAANVLPYIADLGHRIVMYEVYTSIAWIVLGLIILGLAILCFWAFTKSTDTCDGEGAFVVGVLLTIAALVVVGVQIFDIIQAMTLPETLWIQWLTQYAKGVQ